MIMLTLILMPRAVALFTDRVELVHFNDNGQRTHAPLWQWIFNILLPEETICAIAATIPATPVRPIINKMGISEGILKDYDIELRNGGLFNIGRAYHKNTRALESPMSAVVPQGFKELFGVKSHRTAYVIKPRHYDPDKKYPILFFAHGYLGNWLLYTGILRAIDDHIVVCIGTDDLSGIFSRRHIREVNTLYLPMLNDMGYNIDHHSVSLIGLSNGGSAVDAAYSISPNDFRNLIYVSTGVNHTSPTTAKVMIIGGGRDHCAPSMKAGIRRLKANSQKSAICFDEDHTHLKLLSDMDNCIEFLRREL